LMSELMDRPVETFSVTVAGDPLSDERPYAREVARRFGARHHEVVITPDDFVAFLPKMVYHQDEPLADPVCVPLYFVSRLAREHGTIVIQVGEGADELFAGYSGYAIMDRLYRQYYRPFASLPGWLKQPAAAVASAVLPPRRAEYVRRAAAGEELFWGGALAFTQEAKRGLLLDGMGAAHDTHEAVVAAHYRRFDHASPRRTFLERLVYLELMHRLPELLLMRVDKMAMAASVEARVPFLDHELVRFALAIPPSLRLRAGQSKYILKKAARGIIPDHIIDRPKNGFCGGAGNLVGGPVLDHAEQVLTQAEWPRRWVRPEAVRAMLADHRHGRADYGMQIWNLLNVSLWHQYWIEREPVAA